SVLSDNRLPEATSHRWFPATSCLLFGLKWAGLPPLSLRRNLRRGASHKYVSPKVAQVRIRPSGLKGREEGWTCPASIPTGTNGTTRGLRVANSLPLLPSNSRIVDRPSFEREPNAATIRVSGWKAQPPVNCLRSLGFFDDTSHSRPPTATR